MCFIRPSPHRLHTASTLCESVRRSGTALYCHSCKRCAAPKPSIAPEPTPFNSASALERCRQSWVLFSLSRVVQRGLRATLAWSSEQGYTNTFSNGSGQCSPGNSVHADQFAARVSSVACKFRHEEATRGAPHSLPHAEQPRRCLLGSRAPSRQAPSLLRWAEPDGP